MKKFFEKIFGSVPGMQLIKNTLLCSVLIALIAYSVRYSGSADEKAGNKSGSVSCNDEASLNAALSIADLGHVDEAAVLNRGKCVIVGILPDGTETRDELCMAAREIIMREFPRAKKVIVAVDDDTALDVIELAYYIDTELDRRTLVKRFNYLINR